MNRVPPGGAFFIEFIKRKENSKLYLRTYLYNDFDQVDAAGDMYKYNNSTVTEDKGS